MKHHDGNPTAKTEAHTGRTTRRLRFRAVPALVAATAILLAGCGGSAERPTLAPTGPSTTTAAVTRVEAPKTHLGQVVRAVGELVVHEAPDAASPARTLPAATEFGSPTVLLVTDRTVGWVQVLVPGRPLGATAWIQDQGLDVQAVRSEVRVDLAARTLTLFEDGVAVLTSPVAIGSPEAPTPAGTFSVTDKLDTGEPSGAYGPFAIGLSARSEVLTEFAGGDAQIGIHGTNDPASIGQAVSHGCIRVPNDTITELNERLPLGTPIVVA